MGEKGFGRANNAWEKQKGKEKSFYTKMDLMCGEGQAFLLRHI